MPVDNGAVANDQGGLNWKIFTDEPISAANTRIQNLTDNQQIVQGLLQENLAANLSLSRNATANAIAFSQAVTARAVRFAFDISAEQAAGFVTQIGARLEDRITNLGASLAGLQDFIKSANTTPPQTGTGGAFGSDAGSGLLQQLANIQATLQSLETRVTRPAA